ncbi:MAG TPA: histidine kinase [Ferruginibacter sp.]|nr:histidine kinase [Ferruginibacter sp.]HPH89238.1 histidine kinase [Ferruginibacter sp.]
MMKNLSRYWMCQLGGWGAWFATNAFFYFSLSDPDKEKEPLRYSGLLLFVIVLGIFFSHMMRLCIKEYKLLKMPIQRQIFYFLLLTAIFSVLYSSVLVSLTTLLDIHLKEDNIPLLNKLIGNAITIFILFLIWNLIYYIYHYVERNRKQELDTLKLESTVKELELKTIKSHINPHFIFNALNSIRALVDENPARARTAITELSNILRSSMQAEKLETVPLEKELGIVKDYLALEKMRFEERLNIEMHIDEDTLSQPVPPMMLQTLVENAIKHGISKKINGGVVRIVSDFVGDHHVLLVQNTGQLNGVVNSDGFGIKSTQDRLNLLYQGKAKFDIKNLNSDIVESKVTMPVHPVLVIK